MRPGRAVLDAPESEVLDIASSSLRASAGFSTPRGSATVKPLSAFSRARERLKRYDSVPVSTMWER